MNPKYYVDFVENNTYHVYKRTNNKEPLFIDDENRLFFLQKFAVYLSPFIDTFCWTLQKTHFHFLVRIKPAESIKEYLISIPFEKLISAEKHFLKSGSGMSELIEAEWQRFLISYSTSFNKLYKRQGNLFNRSLKRTEVIKESNFTQVVIYIHANAQHHNVCSDFTTYKWSSWHTHISKKPTKLLRNELLEWFGGLERFIETHKSLTEFYYDCVGAIRKIFKDDNFAFRDPGNPEITASKAKLSSLYPRQPRDNSFKGKAVISLSRAIQR